MVHTTIVRLLHSDAHHFLRCFMYCISECPTKGCNMQLGADSGNILHHLRRNCIKDFTYEEATRAAGKALKRVRRHSILPQDSRKSPGPLSFFIYQ